MQQLLKYKICQKTILSEKLKFFHVKERTYERCNGV
jgi:hypothetical protein